MKVNLKIFLERLSKIHPTITVTGYLSQSRVTCEEDRALALKKRQRKLPFEGLQETLRCEILSQKGWLFLEYGTESVATEVLFVKLCRIW